jgi:predicted DCC family thiol-disulfide oxidoreductase YuxK
VMSRKAARGRAVAPDHVLMPDRLVLYESGCTVCARAAAVLTRLDSFGRLRFGELKVEWPRLCALSAPNAVERVAILHAMVDMPAVSGFEAYRSVARVLPIAWPILPILYLPGVQWLGRRADRRIASHRAAARTLPATAADPR